MSDDNLKLMLMRHEGLKLSLYKDSVGIWTIGIGRNLEANGISRDEAMLMLDNDISKAKLGLSHTFPWYLSLDDVRQAVMVDMTFNMGIAGFAKFALTIDHIKRGDYLEASKEMLKSAWSHQVGQRSYELSEMMRTGKCAQ